ncbi:hypothetical protein E2C01_018846 [Portunus trituberculatus]|uniref:Uncharacterized protein n=1 Tax=Portunus trituberculatus TaxID=210409 RepID=A0A5B7DY71_PORTR|nr:hypothetical protein [Portunus trituberculatus]
MVVVVVTDAGVEGIVGTPASSHHQHQYSDAQLARQTKMLWRELKGWRGRLRMAGQGRGGGRLGCGGFALRPGPLDNGNAAHPPTPHRPASPSSAHGGWRREGKDGTRVRGKLHPHCLFPSFPSTHTPLTHCIVSSSSSSSSRGVSATAVVSSWLQNLHFVSLPSLVKGDRNVVFCAASVYGAFSCKGG